MGTKVQFESYFPQYLSMRDVNDDSNSCGWPSYHGDTTFTNGYFSSHVPRVVADTFPEYDKDLVKQTMLQHEATFKDQLYELHRLYRIQKDLMDEFKMKGIHQNRVAGETSLSSSHLKSQVTSEDARKWHISNFHLESSVCTRPSTSGVKDVLMCSIKGSSSQASPIVDQKQGTSKDVEILELRPRKGRRKMLDLQLPADAYMDVEEGDKVRDDPDRSHKIRQENPKCIFVGDGRRDHCQGDKVMSESCSKSAANVDLNEPVDIDDSKVSDHVAMAEEQKPRRWDLLKEYASNSSHRSDNRTSSIPHVWNNGNGKHWYSDVLDSGRNKHNTRSMPLGLQPGKSATTSQSMHVAITKHNVPMLSITNSREAHTLKERTGHVFNFPDTENGTCNSRQSSVFPSNINSSYPATPPSMERPWSRSVTSQMHPHLNSPIHLSRNYLPATGSHGVVQDRCGEYNSNCASSQSFCSEMPYRNGFYHGTSASKEPLAHTPSGNYDYWSYSSANNASSECFTRHGSTKFMNKCIDSSSTNDFNLTKKVGPKNTPEVKEVDGTHEHQVALPWLRCKPACKKELNRAVLDLNSAESSLLQHYPSHLSNENESTKELSHMRSGHSHVEPGRFERSDGPSCRKLLGFLIFEKPPESRMNGGIDINRKNRMLDVNLQCELAVTDRDELHSAESIIFAEKEAAASLSNFRQQIDLNTCITEEVEVKNDTGIDLEAPVVPEVVEETIPGESYLEKTAEATSPLPDDKAESHQEVQDELVGIAAEAIVALSTADHRYLSDAAICNQSEPPLFDLLNWFADIVSSYGEDPQNKLGCVSNESVPEVVDYFESMTLKLTQTKEEDYMPSPLVPEDLKLDDSTSSMALPARTRRGPARRGRQRRDFQRDILPGLASLSRHEVTEDLQTFYGLMKATGRSWHSALTRRSSTRNGGRRGRRRAPVSPPSPPPATTSLPRPPLLQQLNSIEVRLEDRSLTGWGKTTRRPRRQRCPAGNTPSRPLT